MDPTLYSSLPFEEWFRLIAAFFILYKLSAGHKDILDWNPRLCREIIDLEAYLRTVARLLRGAGSSAETVQTPRDEMYFVLPEILESAKHSYVLTRDAPSLVGPCHRVHIDLRHSRRPGTASALASVSKCPATGFWIDKALATDHETNWHGVMPMHFVHPSTQLEKNDELWKGLLNGEDEGMS